MKKSIKYLFLLTCILLNIGCHKDQAPTGLPTLTTDSILILTPKSAQCFATIISHGDSPIISRGVCWSTSSNPIFSPSTNNFYTDSILSNINTGSFETLIGTFLPNTTYYARAFASNRSGIGYPVGYGNEIKFTTPTGIPKIYSFMPSTDTAGGLVTINGYYYQIASVTIGGVSVAFTSTTTSIMARVPANASSGYIIVESIYGADTSQNTFTFIP